MPWCGYWSTSGGSFWWILPLIGLVFMGAMFVACFRGGFGCMGRLRRTSGEPSALRDEVEGLKDEVRKLQRRPS